MPAALRVASSPVGGHGGKWLCRSAVISEGPHAVFVKNMAVSKTPVTGKASLRDRNVLPQPRCRDLPN